MLSHAPTLRVKSCRQAVLALSCGVVSVVGCMLHAVCQVFKWFDIEQPDTSLGVETLGDAFYKLIPGNKPKPCRAHQIFTTVRDGQTDVLVTILAGESEHASQNRLLGSFELVGIRAAPLGEAQIEVVFDINPRFELWVGATDTVTGKSCDIRIGGSIVRPTHELVRVWPRKQM